MLINRKKWLIIHILNLQYIISCILIIEKKLTSKLITRERLLVLF